MEDVCYKPELQLNKAQLLRLASCSYIGKAYNVIIQWAAGTDQTYLVCALCVSGNLSLFASQYIRLPDLLAEIALARGDGSFREFMRKYEKIKLLILYKWFLYPLKEIEARYILELVKARNQVASTIFFLQFDVLGWHKHISL